uniref:Uncharacterized protein n=1 Tax=viral metagenome TaxID=1070528 RepID=A0A6M3K3I7_9ZZZZ
MRIIIEPEGKKRADLNIPFRLYARRADFIKIRDAMNRAIEQGLDPGWISVGENEVKDETIFPYDKTLADKPIYPFEVKP